MNDLISNLLRGSVSSAMYVVLLFTLTKSRFGRKFTIGFVSIIFILNLTSTIWFYLYGDLTALSRFTVVLFLVLGIAIKPLTRLNFMQWSFTFLTTINIAMMIIILSFHLGRLFPEPQYANTVFRFLLYLGVIFLFQKRLLASYQSVVNNWPVFSGLMICIFLNLAYYFFVTDDIKGTLASFKWPLLLLVLLSVAAYGTVFYALCKFTIFNALEMEHKKIQLESGRLHEAAMHMQKLANYDTLTGLPNRRFFFERLEEIVQRSRGTGNKFALLYIDLDGFKEINDMHGHEVGDTVLMEVGKRLQEDLRNTDFVARLGGDEFAVIASDIEDQDVANQLAKKVQTMIQENIHTGATCCTVTASIGIAMFPDTSQDGEALVRDADAAMYTMKRQGKTAAQELVP